MKEKVLSAVAAVFVSFWPHLATATIHHVPSEFASIPAAIAASVAGDTVLVASGVYDASLSVGIPITILSESGPDVTRLQNSSDVVFLHEIRPDTFHLVGFEISSTDGRGIASDFSNFEVDNCNFSHARTAAIHFSGYSGTIRNSRFYDESPSHSGWTSSVFVDNLGKTRLERNIFHGLRYPYAFYTTAQRVDLVNNTIVGCNGGFNVGNSYGSPGTVYNNIFLSLSGTAIVTDNSVGPAIDYNLYYSNGNNVVGGMAGVNSLFVDPLLADTTSGDFTPLAGSPLIDAGDPDPIYDDPDGSRNDIGAILGQTSLPYLTSLVVQGEGQFHVTNNTPTFAWGYRDTLAAQMSFELEVGTDNDWSGAEKWATGMTSSPDTFVVYAGSPLNDGEFYYVRVRASNGVDWSAWRSSSFRLNTHPTVPTPIRPIGGAETHPLGTVLGIVNSVDAEEDLLRYEFEVFADAGLGIHVISYANVPSMLDSTFTPLLDSIQPESDYWWRARAFDGWEHSEWSIVAMFHARSSRVIEVPADYSTIPEAISAASEYDTILVYPGSYVTNLDLLSKQLRLISAGGPKVTTLTQAYAGLPIILAGAHTVGNTEVAGFTFMAPADNPAITVASGSPVIRNNIFRDSPTPYGYPPVKIGGGNPLIENNLFRDNQAVAALGIYGGSARIINNTFINNLRGFFTLSGQGVALNNIVINSAEYGIYGVFDQRDYNDLWMNSPDYATGAAGVHDISADPAFLDSSSGDYSLLPTSSCMNAGDPDPQYDDPDGSRCDIGAYPFVGPLPFALSIFVFAEDQFHVVGDAPRFRWTFYDTAGAMSGYEIQVGTDNEWSTAESWSSGQIASSLSIAQYAGAPLVDGDIYYLRLRLNNGTDWGTWNSYIFRMNSRSAAPSLVSPTDGDSLHYQSIRSVFANPVDLEGDSLSYEVELYLDSTLLNLVDVQMPSAGAVQTESAVWANLQLHTPYWWRVRASDGWEYSDWSVTREFFARGPGIVRVPQKALTIADAIEMSGTNDTVLVGPGDYYINLNLAAKVVHLLSSDGAATTTLRSQQQSLQPISLDNPPPDSVEIAGFTFVGGQAASVITLNGGSPRIHHNAFRDFNGQSNPSIVLYILSGSPIITHNVFMNNKGVSCIGIYGGDPTVVNNTFDRNNGGLHLIDGTATILNNIVTGSSTFGFYGYLPNEDYNCLYGNFPNHDQNGSGPHDISVSPMYYDAVGGDFRLQTGSPCINAGDPDMAYNDLDGSRNDMGAVAAVCACGCHADPICDHQTDILDVAFVIAGAFRGLAEMDDSYCFAHGQTVAGRTDVNCSGSTDVVDVVRVIDVAFRGANPAVAFCTLCAAP